MAPDEKPGLQLSLMTASSSSAETASNIPSSGVEIRVESVYTVSTER